MTGHADAGHTVAVDLSVVIPVLNAASFLPPQLEALSRQNYRGDWELIVADNGSRGGTLGVVGGFVDRLPLRVVVADGRRCPAAACNHGAAAATGRYLVFLDADDVVDTSYLSAMA